MEMGLPSHKKFSPPWGLLKNNIFIMRESEALGWSEHTDLYIGKGCQPSFYIHFSTPTMMALKNMYSRSPKQQKQQLKAAQINDFFPLLLLLLVLLLVVLLLSKANLLLLVSNFYSFLRLVPSPFLTTPKNGFIYMSSSHCGFSEISSACYVRRGRKRKKKEINLWKRWKHHPIFCVYGTFRKTSSSFYRRSMSCVLSRLPLVVWQTLSRSFKSILFNFTARLNNSERMEWKIAQILFSPSERKEIFFCLSLIQCFCCEFSF